MIRYPETEQWREDMSEVRRRLHAGEIGREEFESELDQIVAAAYQMES